MRRYWQILALLVVAIYLLPACSSDSTSITDPSSADKSRGLISHETQIERDVVWGGTGVRMQIINGSAYLEFDCAHGYIGLMADMNDDGRFTTRGSYTMEGFGPIRPGEEPVDHPAYYSGRVENGVMSLYVRLTDTGDQFGPFVLTRNCMGLVRKCL